MYAKTIQLADSENKQMRKAGMYKKPHLSLKTGLTIIPIAAGVAGLPLLFGEHQASHHPKGLLTQTLEEKQAFWRKLYWEPDPHNERQWMMPGSENIFEVGAQQSCNSWGGGG